MREIGGRGSPPNYFKCAMEAGFVKNIIDQAMEGHPSLFVVDWSLSADNNIKVCVDGDQGVDIEAVIAVSRAIEHHPDMDRDREDFSISVSSPGADAPLILPRQYAKHVGRKLKVTTDSGEEFTGTLTDAGQDGIALEWAVREPKPVGKGKHTVTYQKTIPFADIKKAKVVIKF